MKEPIAQGVVEKFQSPWSSTIVLIKKNVIVKDSYPLPRVDNTLDALVDARCSSL